MVVVKVGVMNTGVLLFVGVLFSGLKGEELLFPCLEERKEMGIVFFKPCKRSALDFPEGQKQ